MDRIVVGVDGTPESVAAARYASGLARKLHSSITLAFVVPSYAPLGPEELLGQRQQWEDAEAKRGRQILREVSAACELPEGMVESQVLNGDAADALAETARAAIMIVVGHRHRGAVARTLLGSVADRLTQVSPVPLLVVPQAARHSALPAA